MSPTASPTNGNAASPAPVLPDQRFWRKYSPRHELSVSSATSVLLHSLVVALLVFGAALAARWASHPGNGAPEVQAVIVAPPGGDGGAGLIPKGEEAVDAKADTPASTITAPRREELNKVDVKPQAILPDQPRDDGRAIDLVEAALGGPLSQVGTNVKDKLDRMLSKPGGPGRPGSGDGPSVGPRQGKVDPKRPQRQLRWTLIFNTRDGGDYLRQLHALGAILAIPDPDGHYRLARDLMRRPVELKTENLADLDRIYWIDDRPQSVQSLTRALGLALHPDHVAAFFPAELEKILLDKELQYLRQAQPNKSEDDIVETVFTLRKRGAGYEPVVKSQRTK